TITRQMPPRARADRQPRGRPSRYRASMRLMRKVPPAHPATFEDLARIPEEKRFHEIIRGEIVEKASPGGEHGGTQVAIGASLFGPCSRRPGGPLPGGWWFGVDVDIVFERHEVYRPDVAGWRRERCPERPAGMPVYVRPDWVCEVLSPSNARNDQVAKFETYR